MTLRDDLKTLDRLTDAEADNLRTAIRQGDLDESAWPMTWATVSDSWAQMPDEVRAHYGDPRTVTAALGRVLALVGYTTDVVQTYALPDYEELAQTEEEIALLVKHDLGEELHEFVPNIDTGGVTCGECDDTEEGLMHNNAWRNVEPLLEDKPLPDDAEGIKEAQGWTDSTFLDLALEYIDNQQDNGAWVDFLQEKARLENE